MKKNFSNSRIDYDNRLYQPCWLFKEGYGRL